MMRRLAFVAAVVSLAILVATAPVAGQTITVVDADESFEIGDGESHTFELDLPDAAMEVQSATFDVEICDDQGQTASFSLEIDGVELGNDTTQTPTEDCLTRTLEFDDTIVDVDGDTASVEFIFDDAAASPTVSSEPTDTQEFEVRQLDPEFSSPTETGTEEPPTELSVDVDDLDGEDELEVVFERHDGEEIGSDTVTEPGTASVSWDWTAADTDDNGQLSWTAKSGLADLSSSFDADSAAPSISNIEPDGGIVESTPVTLSLDVDDDDFGEPLEDEVVIEWYVNDEHIRTSSHESAETVETEVESELLVAGENEWEVVATDQFGNEVTESQTWTMPSELEIRDIKTEELIDDAEVTVEFFSGEIITQETTEDGTIDLGGVSGDLPISITVSADDYHSRETILRSVFDQQQVYLLEDDEEVDSVRQIFKLNDLTGQFRTDDTFLLIQRPLDLDGDNRTWKTVEGARFGAANEVIATLEEGQRHRLILENDRGEERRLGDYTAEEDGTVELEVGQVEWSAERDTYRWSAEFVEFDDGTAQIVFRFEDDTEETDLLELEIYDRGDEENVLAEETAFGPIGSETFAIAVDGDDLNVSTWVVNWSAGRGDETLGAQRMVGPQTGVMEPPVPDDWVLVLIAVALIFIGMLFGGVFGAFAAVGVSSVATLLWWLGWFEASGGLLLAVLVVSVLFVAGGRR